MHGGSQRIVTGRSQGRHHLHHRCNRETVPGNALGRRDRNLICARSEHRSHRPHLGDIVNLRPGTMGIDVVDGLRAQPRARQRSPHRRRQTVARGIRCGGMVCIAALALTE